MVEQALPAEGAVGRPANLRCPAGARVWCLGLGVQGVWKNIPVSVLAHVDDAACACFGQVLARASAIVDVRYNRSAFVASAALELGWDCLQQHVALASRRGEWHRRLGGHAYSSGLLPLLLRTGIWVELESRNAGILGALDDLLLGLVGRDLALGVLGGLDGALLLELVGIFG